MTLFPAIMALVASCSLYSPSTSICPVCLPTTAARILASVSTEITSTSSTIDQVGSAPSTSRRSDDWYIVCTNSSMGSENAAIIGWLVSNLTDMPFGNSCSNLLAITSNVIWSVRDWSAITKGLYESGRLNVRMVRSSLWSSPFPSMDNPHSWLANSWN